MLRYNRKKRGKQRKEGEIGKGRERVSGHVKRSSSSAPLRSGRSWSGDNSLDSSEL